ncbi:hypothetical protein VTK26DRAFT_1525 [Humicola hyalothermophila]
MNHPQSFAREFLRRLESRRSAGTRSAKGAANSELPRFDFRDRDLLVTHSQPQSFRLGTGASIFTNCLIPAITSARSEVILVTCFWAPSATLTALHDALTALARHRSALIRDVVSREEHNNIPTLHVRICLSSRSFLQKLLHPQSRHGYVYPPSSWPTKLGLPGPALLREANIELQVKSLFFLPFSVMHPKFVIIDRQRAFVPSCNVSFEPWLEGCVEITGAAVQSLLSFYTQTWDPTTEVRHLLEHEVSESRKLPCDGANLALIASTADRRVALATGSPTPTLILPSSHHRNPHFRPFPWQTHHAPPTTPLNIALFQLFDQAQRSIFVQTPNLTCEPVLAALLDALDRGVDVTIVTNRDMMVIEQLVTAGTTTSWSIRSLVRRFNKLGAAPGRQHSSQGTETRDSLRHLEAGHRRIGRLRISYFRARRHSAPTGGGGRGQLNVDQGQSEEPVHSHLKLTLVDDEFTVLGSGNLDRASIYTSQELGVMFHDRELATKVKAAVDSVLEARLDPVFDSEETRV